MQGDPIGVAGGINIYLYANGSPTIQHDEYGLRPLTITEKSYLSPYIDQKTLDSANIITGEMPWYIFNNATATTSGNDIYFRNPNINFTSPRNLAILAHELVHVEQYANGLNRFTYLMSEFWNFLKTGSFDQSPYEVAGYSMEEQVERSLSQKYGKSCP